MQAEWLQLAPAAERLIAAEDELREARRERDAAVIAHFDEDPTLDPRRVGRAYGLTSVRVTQILREGGNGRRARQQARRGGLTGGVGSAK